MSSDLFGIEVLDVEGRDVRLAITPTTAGDLCAKPGTRSLVLMLLWDLGEPLSAQVRDKEWVKEHVDAYVTDAVVERIDGFEREDAVRRYSTLEHIPLASLVPRTTLRATVASPELASRFSVGARFGTTSYDVWWDDPRSQREPKERALPTVYAPDPELAANVAALLATRLTGYRATDAVSGARPGKWPPDGAVRMRTDSGDAPIGSASGDRSFVLEGEVASLWVSMRSVRVSLRDVLLVATEIRAPRVLAVASAAVEAKVAEINAAKGPAAKKKSRLRGYEKYAKELAEHGTAVARGYVADPAASPDELALAAPWDELRRSLWLRRFAGDPERGEIEPLEALADRLASVLQHPSVGALLRPEGLVGLMEAGAEQLVRTFSAFSPAVQPLSAVALPADLPPLRWAWDDPVHLGTRVATHAALGDPEHARAAAAQVVGFQASLKGFAALVNQLSPS